MKNIIAIALALIMVGCNEPTQQVDVNEAEAVQCCLNFEDVENELYGYALELYQIHIELDGFAEALPTALLERLGEQCYPDLSDLIEALYIWQEDGVGDVLVEWPTWDDFIATVAYTKWARFFIN